jgi:hypothetical protein
MRVKIGSIRLVDIMYCVVNLRNRYIDDDTTTDFVPQNNTEMVRASLAAECNAHEKSRLSKKELFVK